MKTCLDCAYHERLHGPLIGMTLDVCSRPEMRGRILPYPRCENYLDREVSA